MRFFSTLIASVLGTFIALALVFVFFFFLIFAVAATTDDAPRVQDGSVLVVDVSGAIPEIVPDDPFVRAFGEGQHGLRTYTRALEKAAVDDRIDAVWIRPRGLATSWANLNEMGRALEGIQAAGKPVYASSDDHLMQEADYYLASLADSVFASPEAPFFYNGFVATSQFFEGTLEMLNVEPEIVRAGEFKTAAEQFTRSDLSPEDRMQTEALLETNEEQFIQHVSAARDRSPEALRALADEGILTAAKAHEEGLIDVLLYPDQVRDVIKEALGLAPEDDLNTISIDRYRSVSAQEAGLEESRENEVAIVYADGAIMSGQGDQSPFGGSAIVGSHTFRDAMETARTTDRIQAVVVRVNSPGGAAAAADEMWRAVQLTREEKPVIISMGSLAASGGYWLAAAGDHIMANPQTITGSIGVFSLLFDASGFFEESLGITFDQVQTSPTADMFSGLNPLSPSERQLLEESTQRTYNRFLERVAENRGRDVTAIDSVAQGRVWSGEDALEVGLVDELGGLQLAIERAAEHAELEPGTWRTRVVPRPQTFLEQLTGSLSAQARTVWLRVRYSPAERALLDYQHKLEQLSREHGTVQARLPFDITIE